MSESDSPLASPAASKEDHRVRTGAHRREQTRRKLLAAALEVFADKGPDAALIDDVIVAAGVSRGTFYNHFTTTQDLLDALTSSLSDQILATIDEVVLPIPDPLRRVTCGCLLYMHAGIDVKNWGAFLVRTGMRGGAVGKLVDVYLPRDLELARQAGAIGYPTVRAARDLVIGGITQAILTVHQGEAPRGHLRAAMMLVLRGLGVPAAEATALAEMPLPALRWPTPLKPAA